MSTSLLTLVPRLLVGLILHRAREWLGPEFAKTLDAALSPEGDTTWLARVQEWLERESTTRQLRLAAQTVEEYVQQHCDDPTLRQVFTLTFADLPSVQAALADVPRAMDLDAVRASLREALQRDAPHLSPKHVQQAVDCYASALQRALLNLEEFALPLIGHAVLDLRAQQDQAFAQIQAQLDTILGKLNTGRPLTSADIATLRTAITLNQVLVSGDVNRSVIIIGHNNTVTLSGGRLQQVRENITLPGDLPPGSYLPFVRNTTFTGREDALGKLAEILLAEDGRAVVQQAITGMGGVGKTQLAIEFAYRYGYRFRGVHWLDLSDPDLLDERIALNGENMGLFAGADPLSLPERVQLILNQWKAEGPRLIILDNFEAVDRAQEVLVRLQHSNLRLLITTRRKDWHPGLDLSPLSLDEFTAEESRAFLRHWLPPERASDADLDALAQRLGHLPLALELAARYLHHLRGKSVADYLDDLKTVLAHRSMQNWKPAQRTLTGHDLNLARTFALSWEQVTNTRARRIFVAAGYCAPNEPLPVVALRGLVEDEDALYEALADLEALGLLKEGEPPAIHPLLAEFARGQDSGYTTLGTLAETLADLASQTNENADRTGDYGLFTPLVPHVRAVAARVEALGPEGPVPWHLAARLWNSLGYHLHDVADYAGAKEAYERALGIDEAAFGPHHPKVAIRVNNLGGVLKAQGHLDQAREAYERALGILEQHLGPEHPNMATLWNNLGLVLKDLGHLDQAREAFERALGIDEAAFGPHHPNVARDVNNLGTVLKDLGHLDQAREALERALRILEKFLPPDHPHIRTVRENLRSVKGK